jgi:hypothetical protein
MGRVNFGEHEMKLSDARVIEFLSKSPLKSFPAMLDVLRYMDGKWMWEDLEYELFDDVLGGEERVKIRVPSIRGIAANALLAFAWHAIAFDVLRRRLKRPTPMHNQPEEIIAFYELTPSGGYMVKILEVLTDISVRAESAG